MKEEDLQIEKGLTAERIGNKKERVSRAQEAGSESVKNPVEFATNKSAEIQEMILAVDADARYEIARLEGSSSANTGSIEQARQEVRVLEKTQDIRERALEISEDFEKELQEMLGSVFPEEKKPIKPGEIFFPEVEIREILQMPSSQRKEALASYKEKLVYQKEGLAKAQENLMMLIRVNPEMTRSELLKSFDRWGKVYGFTPWQRSVAEVILADYEKKHEAVSRVRSEHPNDQELFREIFGTDPKGKIEVVPGPMTLYFRCHDLEDYALIHSQAFTADLSVSEADKKSADLSGGASSGSAPKEYPELAGTIIAENAKSRSFNEWSRSVLVHEEQHAIHRLFKTVDLRENTFRDLKQASDDQERERLMTTYFRYIRESSGETRVKDEVLAFMKEGKNSAPEVFKILTKSIQDGGLYDYFNKPKYTGRKSKKEAISEFVLKSLKRGGDAKFSDLVHKTVEKVFKQEYEDMIKDGLASYQMLIRYGYSREQTTAILMKVPFSHWKNEVRHLLKEKIDKKRGGTSR